MGGAFPGPVWPLPSDVLDEIEGWVDNDQQDTQVSLHRMGESHWLYKKIKNTFDDHSLSAYQLRRPIHLQYIFAFSSAFDTWLGSHNRAPGFRGYAHEVFEAVGPDAVQLRFHGPIRKCNMCEQLHDSTNGRISKIQSPCHGIRCSLCNILRNSFRMERACSYRSLGSYGQGIYSSRFSRQSFASPSTLKAIIICQVIVGNVQTLTQQQYDPTDPDLGYHSAAGGDVEYAHRKEPETVVNRDDATIPLGIALYKEGV
ncbi:hypothetical protein QBC44DRAFT_390528 [Cladorrhinum sp. PSN332]|nr:hypothetical protein QBC44DRAFT_390528 [Cladorrhinum sp. PSN332]